MTHKIFLLSHFININKKNKYNNNSTTEKKFRSVLFEINSLVHIRVDSSILLLFNIYTRAKLNNFARLHFYIIYII